MVRNTAREIAVHLAYELSFTDKTAEELVAERLSRDGFAELAGEDELSSEAPNAKQAEYIRALVCGVADHAPELDEFIARYAKGWSFDRIPARGLRHHARGDVRNSLFPRRAELRRHQRGSEIIEVRNARDREVHQRHPRLVRARGDQRRISKEAEHRARRRSALYIRHLQRKNASQENAWNSK